MIWNKRSELASTPIRGSRFAGGWSSATVIAPGSAEVFDVQLQAKRQMTDSAAQCFTAGLYRYGTRSNFNYGFAQFANLAGNTRFQMRAIAQRHEFDALLQLQNPLDGFLDTLAKCGALASLRKDRFERPV